MLSSCDNVTHCPATVTDVSFERNTAVEAAGGAAYAVGVSAIQGLSCLLPYTQASTRQQQQQQRHTITSPATPSSCWASGNAAVGPQAYAPSLATSASSISPNISDGDYVPNGAFLLLAVPIMDAAGNVMTLVGAENETVRATITSIDASPFVNRTLYTGPSAADSAAGGGVTRDKGYLEMRGVTMAPVVKGAAMYTTMALSGTPGQRFHMQLALGSGRWAVQPLKLSLQMQWCSVGQILAGDSCEACIPGTHNFGGAVRCEPKTEKSDVPARDMRCMDALVKPHLCTLLGFHLAWHMHSCSQHCARCLPACRQRHAVPQVPGRCAMRHRSPAAARRHVAQPPPLRPAARLPRAPSLPAHTPGQAAAAGLPAVYSLPAQWPGRQRYSQRGHLHGHAVRRGVHWAAV